MSVFITNDGVVAKEVNFPKIFVDEVKLAPKGGYIWLEDYTKYNEKKDEVVYFVNVHVEYFKGGTKTTRFKIKEIVELLSFFEISQALIDKVSKGDANDFYDALDKINETLSNYALATENNTLKKAYEQNQKANAEYDELFKYFNTPTH